MSVIDVEHLTKDYGSGRGVFDVSFRVDKGEVFGFLGPNGAGKSTTIRHLMGFSKPDSGSTKIFGRETFEKYFEILGRVGYIPGEIALPAGLTGWEFLRMMQALQKCRNEERLAYLLKIFELDPSGETKRMSLGVKRKLAVVAAFMSDPDVLILDEPAAGLDPKGRDKILAQIKKYHDEYGKTILLVSHSMEDIVKYAGKVLVMNKSRLFCYDTVDRVFARTDELAKIGLDVPQITRMSHILKSLGTDIGNDIYTTQRAAERLLPLIR